MKQGQTMKSISAGSKWTKNILCFNIQHAPHLDIWVTTCASATRQRQYRLADIEDHLGPLIENLFFTLLVLLLLRLQEMSLPASPQLSISDGEVCVKLPLSWAFDIAIATWIAHSFTFCLLYKTCYVLLQYSAITNSHFTVTMESRHHNGLELRMDLLIQLSISKLTKFAQIRSNHLCL